MRTALASLFLCFSMMSAFAQQDTIANPGFEQWNFNPNFDDPIGWTTLNPLASILGAQLAFKAEAAGEFHSGTAAIKLETTNVTGIGITPSILTNGSINTATQNVEGGTAFASRPTSVSGWFRFDPVNEDTGFVNITLTRWDATGGTRVMVGEGAMNVLGTSGSFENMEVTINYLDPGVPDTVLILIGSGTDLSPQQGTALFVDDLYYTYPQSVESAESVGLNLYPNPTSDRLSVLSSTGFTPKLANIISIDGALRSSVRINNGTLNVSSLTTGTYLLELIDANGKIVRQSFVKQ